MNTDWDEGILEMPTQAEKKNARWEYEKNLPLIEKIVEELHVRGIVRSPEKYHRHARDKAPGLEKISLSRLSKALSESVCANREGTLKQASRALQIEFDDQISRKEFGGYSFRDHEKLLGDYHLVRPCFDKSEYIALFPSRMFSSSAHGCFRLESMGENGETYSGNVSILSSLGMIEISMADGGYNFLGILFRGSEGEPLKGMLMTLGKDLGGRWIPMCMPMALVSRELVDAGNPCIVSSDAKEYNVLAETLQSVIDFNFVKTINEIRKATT